MQSITILQLQFQADQSVPWSAKAWRQHTQKCESDAHLTTSIPYVVQNHITTALSRGEDDGLRAALEQKRRHLHFTTAVWVERLGGWASVDDGELNIELVRDLFDSPREEKHRPHVLVKVSLQPDRKATGVLKDAVRPQYAPAPYDYWRVGDAIEIADCASANPGNGDPSISHHEVLLAWRRKEKPQKIHLMKMPVYDFGDFCVGDKECDDWGAETPMRPNYRWRPEYETIRTASNPNAELRELLKQHPPDERGWTGPGVPFLPYYTFNIYQPNTIDVGISRTSWTSGKLRVAVRCVSFLASVDVDFPADIRFSVAKGKDTHAAVCEQIKTALRTADNEGDVPKSAVLFDEKHDGEWKMQLWVMPQTPDQAKLYDWRAKTAGKLQHLTDFISHDFAKIGDGRLFVEAHIVPKDGEWRLTGTPVEGEAPEVHAGME
ncbi:hypothetical protein LTR85_007952 [Meristemomyces frigidus]|nr:hypothetical protein LTR85_007952 [Meristemomyces frigidus]